jgi:DNA invertase Pin-like site-specific DNA recombinase
MVFSDRMVPEVIQPFWAALQRGEFITDEQDLTAQRDGLARLGVEPERIYVDHGLTGTTRARPGLREALAACRDGDTLVVTKLDGLARSPDARDIADELTARQVELNLGGSVHDPTDPSDA